MNFSLARSYIDGIGSNSRALCVVRSGYIQSEQSFSKYLNISQDVIDKFKIASGFPDPKRHSLNFIERKMAEKHVEEIFSLYPPPTFRFSKGINALYTSRSVKTINEERKHQIMKRIENHWRTAKKMVYTNFLFKIGGRRKNISKMFLVFPQLSGEDFSFCHEVAKYCIKNGVEIIEFPSVRHPNGLNQCTYSPTIVRSLGVESRTIFKLSQDMSGVKSVNTMK